MADRDNRDPQPLDQQRGSRRLSLATGGGVVVPEKGAAAAAAAAAAPSSSSATAPASPPAAAPAAPATGPPAGGATAAPAITPASAGETTGESPRAGADADADADTVPPFEPLFTLLTNTTTNATIHPRVHYLFSDDDNSVLAAPQDNPSHRTLIVDLAAPTAPQGAWSISWASSLSPDFAVTGSHLSLQHGGDDGDEAAGGGGGAGPLMLRVEGVEREPVDPQQQDAGTPVTGSGSVAAAREDTESLVEDFRRRMGVLKKVVQEGERRREIVEQLRALEQEQEQEQAHEHGQEHEISHDAEDRASEETGLATTAKPPTPAIITEPVHP